MRFWQFLRFIPPEQLPALAQAVEAAGLDGIVLGDHLAFPKTIESHYPYAASGKVFWDPNTPWPDVWVSIAAMAAVTKRIWFSTNIFVLPLRHPLIMARSAATLALLSGDRVALGTGVGWMEEEYRAAGVDFRTRGRRYDEMIDLMRRLWTGEKVEHHGEFFDFAPLQVSPRPNRPVPIWMAGGSAPAMRRAAAKGDGWITGAFTAETVDAMIGEMRALLKAAGRENAPFELIAPVGRDLDLIRRLRDLGATQIIDLASRRDIGPDRSLQEKTDYFKRYADEVVARV